MTPCAIAVIGHVDHGKTALVRALTGIETDRLQEERERGLSITLGFAWIEGASGTFDIIDAPGHEDFIRTMTAGVSGARAILLVVSAVDGFERQTHEHLRIAGLMGVGAGVVAVTKSDLLSPDDHVRTAATIEETLAGTILHDAPIVFCSARTGVGLDTLRQAMDDLAKRCPPRLALGGFYLPIDRVFTVKGAGTIVTGTLSGGALRAGAAAVFQPSGRDVTIRGLQARGAEAKVLQPGLRAAVNVRGAAAQDIRVGDVLCPPDLFPPSRRLDAKVTLTPDCRRPLKTLDQIRVLLGTRAATASARILEGSSISPGGSGWVQLRFEGDVVAHAGQHVVLRRPSPPETIGGAVVLDSVPSISGRRNAERIAVMAASEGGDPLQIARALAARDAGRLDIADLARLTHLPPETLSDRLAEDFDVLDGRHLARRQVLDQARADYLAAVALAHCTAPTRPGEPLATIRRAVVGVAAPIVERVEALLMESGDIVLAKGLIALRGHDPIAALGPGARARLEEIEAALRAGGATPPDPPEARDASRGDGDLVELLLASGRAVALRNVALRRTLLFHPTALEAALQALTAAFPPPTMFKTGEAREALATSRKFIVPILEYFDASGWTARDGDARRIVASQRDCIRPLDL